MDKLDDLIKESSKDMAINNNFTDETITKIKHSKKSIFWHSLKFRILAGALVVLIIALEIISSFSSPKVATNKVNLTVASKANNASTQPINSSTEPSNIPAADNNVSLAADVNSIDSSINQENNDQTFANRGLNDSQYEITIPTN